MVVDIAQISTRSTLGYCAHWVAVIMGRWPRAAKYVRKYNTVLPFQFQISLVCRCFILSPVFGINCNCGNHLDMSIILPTKWDKYLKKSDRFPVTTSIKRMTEVIYRLIFAYCRQLACVYSLRVAHGALTPTLPPTHSSSAPTTSANVGPLPPPVPSPDCSSRSTQARPGVRVDA